MSKALARRHRRHARRNPSTTTVTALALGATAIGGVALSKATGPNGLGRATSYGGPISMIGVGGLVGLGVGALVKHPLIGAAIGAVLGGGHSFVTAAMVTR